MAALHALADGVKQGVIVNIGTFKGGSAIALSEVHPSVFVVAVDNFVGIEDGSAGGDELEGECVANLNGRPNICLLRCDSATAASLIRTEVAAVFVDGDHSYEGCLSDLEVWWPRIRSGGLLCGHDCVAGVGVPQALLEFCMSRGVKADVLTGACHGFFVVRKP